MHNLVVNKEERIPDIGYFRAGGGADPASGKRYFWVQGQNFSTEIFRKYGKDTLKRFVTQWFDYSESRMRQAISALELDAASSGLLEENA